MVEGSFGRCEKGFNKPRKPHIETEMVARHRLRDDGKEDAAQMLISMLDNTGWGKSLVSTLR